VPDRSRAPNHRLRAPVPLPRGDPRVSPAAKTRIPRP